MTPQSSLSFTLLEESTLAELALESGPCLTLCLPPSHPGASELPRSTTLLNLLREAESLTANTPDLPADFLVPIRDLLKARNFNDGGHALAIFRAPDFFLLAQAPDFLAPSATLGSHFLLAPFLEDSISRREAYLLSLNQKHLHFYLWSQGQCLEIALPSAVPASLDAAMAFDVPDHNRENRSSAGPSTGAMPGVRFGTSSDADNLTPHLHDFFKQIDRGLKEVLHLHPLLLAGLPQHTHLYRSIAVHSQLLPLDLPADLPFQNRHEIGQHIQQALLNLYRQQGLAVLAQHQELRDRSRAITASNLIFDAAAGGRIHQLVCTLESANEPDTNAAIAETLGHNGEVYLLPAATLPRPDAAPAAILRY